MEVARNQPKVLMLGANALVRDDVRVLLGSMGYHCVVASTLKEALALIEVEKPDAAVLDPRQVGSPPARMVAAFQKMAPSLRGRTIVLTGTESDPEVLRVLDAYSLRQVPRDLLLQELWPSLDSLLRPNIVPRQVVRSARLVLDSFLQPSYAGVRSSQQLSARRLLYESGDLVADLSLEPEGDWQRIMLVGQVLAQSERQVGSLPVVLQGQAGPIAVATTNELGDFYFGFDSEPGVTLEIGVEGNHWVSVELPDPKGAIRETTEESQFQETAADADSEARNDLLPKRKKRP